MWDKIAITKDLRFDTRTLKWKGITDYAGETTIIPPNGLAYHILVLCSAHSWMQLFAWFGTKRAAPGIIW